jgi:hypothetical protein
MSDTGTGTDTTMMLLVGCCSSFVMIVMLCLAWYFLAKESFDSFVNTLLGTAEKSEDSVDIPDSGPPGPPGAPGTDGAPGSPGSDGAPGSTPEDTSTPKPASPPETAAPAPPPVAESKGIGTECSASTKDQCDSGCCVSGKCADAKLCFGNLGATCNASDYSQCDTKCCISGKCAETDKCYGCSAPGKMGCICKSTGENGGCESGGGCVNGWCKLTSGCVATTLPALSNGEGDWMTEDPGVSATRCGRIKIETTGATTKIKKAADSWPCLLSNLAWGDCSSTESNWTRTNLTQGSYIQLTNTTGQTLQADQSSRLILTNTPNRKKSSWYIHERA